MEVIKNKNWDNRQDTRKQISNKTRLSYIDSRIERKQMYIDCIRNSLFSYRNGKGYM